MNVMPEQHAALVAAERQREAARHNAAARVLAARRLQRRAETATRRAYLARLALQP